MTDSLIDLNGRVRDRAREERQRRVRLLRNVLVVLAVIGVVGWVVTGSPLFAARRVVVTGNHVVATETILQQAAVPMGAPLFQIDTGGLAKRVTAIAGVGRGDVSIALPDTVSIRVTERAVVFVMAVDGGFAWIDPSGERFNESTDRPDNVPLAEADPTQQRLLADIATVAGALPSRLTARVKVISAETRDSIVITTNDGVSIIWGSAESSSLKGQVADSLSRAQPKVKTIDVSSPTHPTTR